GAVLPRSAGLVRFEPRCKAGFEMAAAHMKAATGKTVRIVYEDSKGTPEGAAAAAKRLVEVHKVSAIMGEVSGTLTEAMVAAVKGKAVILSPLAATPQLVGIDPWFFSIWPSDADEMPALAGHAFEKLGMKRVAVIVQDSKGAASGAKAFRKAFEEKKAEV